MFFDGDRGVVHQKCPTASARPPKVMMLMVSPRADSAINEVKIESGMVTAMIKVGAPVRQKTAESSSARSRRRRSAPRAPRR